MPGSLGQLDQDYVKQHSQYLVPKRKEGVLKCYFILKVLSAWSDYSKKQFTYGGSHTHPLLAVVLWTLCWLMGVRFSLDSSGCLD